MTDRTGRPAGRRSIFRGGEVRVQGYLTKPGAKLFEAKRAELKRINAEITGVEIDPSDANTIEFMARGEEGTRRYLRELVQQDRRREAKEKKAGK